MRPVTPQAPSPLECREVVSQLWEYLDERLEPESVVAIDEHLALCEGCRALAGFEKRLVGTLAGLRGRHTDPVRLREDVLAVLRQAGLRGNDSAESPA